MCIDSWTSYYSNFIYLFDHRLPIMVNVRCEKVYVYLRLVICKTKIKEICPPHLSSLTIGCKDPSPIVTIDDRVGFVGTVAPPVKRFYATRYVTT